MIFDLENIDPVFAGFPANSSYCARTSDLWRTILHQFGSRDDLRRCAILFVQDYVGSPHFTQRNFFSDYGIAMLAESPAISDRITRSAIFEPWSHVENASRPQVVADVCVCVNQALDRRRVIKVSQEQWYAVGRIRPSSEDSASRSGVRISNIVEEGRVEYVPVRVPFPISPGPSNLRVCSGKSKKKTISRSSVKRRFKVASPPPASQQHRIVEDLGFSAALDRHQFCNTSWHSESKRKAAPVFQGGLPLLLFSSPTLGVPLHHFIRCYLSSSALWNCFASFNYILIFM